LVSPQSKLITENTKKQSQELLEGKVGGGGNPSNLK